VNLFSLQDRHVVVTGAGRGLGRAIAEAVAVAGAHVTLVARTQSQLLEVKGAIVESGGTADVSCVDLSDLSAVTEMGRLLASSGVDSIVHAAGITHREDATDFTDDDLARVLKVNLEAPFSLSRELVKARNSPHEASHVFIGSLGSSIGIPRAVAYVASKSGVLGVVRTLAVEWASLGVRVNLLSPGYFHTALTDAVLDTVEKRARMESRIPMGRLGLPEELGGAAVFLLSRASSYVTGQQIIVDGGWLSS
jgi:2-deoxy-D-gluconate 3-dehydrogenase